MGQILPKNGNESLPSIILSHFLLYGNIFAKKNCNFFALSESFDDFNKLDHIRIYLISAVSVKKALFESVGV